MDKKYLTKDPIRRDDLLEDVRDTRCGAVATFSGDIRNHSEQTRAASTNHSEVTGITYDVHGKLAEKKLESIERRIEQRQGISHCRIQHRVGFVPVGESSVFIAVSAPHRKPAFRALEDAIDTLKETVPIWKEEHYGNKESSFVEGTPL